VFMTVRTGGPVSLANAFVKPIAPSEKQSLVEKSISEMDSYYGRLVKMYGEGGRTASAFCTLDDISIANLKEKKNSVDEVIATAVAAAFSGGAA